MIQDSMFIGVGWGFPPSFDRYSRSVEMVQEEVDIHQSLQVLFTTTPGERTMELNYGCDLSPLAFQPLDLNLKTFMINNIKEAIKNWEPRIRVTEIKLDVDNTNDLLGMVNIYVSYIIKSTNMPGKLVYNYSFE